MDWLARFLFTHTRQLIPDGRPLYAYKMSDAQYADFRTHFHQVILLDPQGKRAKRFAPIFCLYAAETFRREHTDGVWTWETVFRPLGKEAPPQVQIGDWVEKGLDWWQRPLLRSATGNREFLVTIACEGGLPLRLLQQENAHLTQFFRTVLDSYYRTGQGDIDAAILIARQQAHRLPRSLRHEAVFHLTGSLIAKISELQQLVGEAADPVVALDAKLPDWRRDLPLQLDDQVAETLLIGLVRRSGELAQETAARLRWRGGLRETATGWQVEKRLVLPERPTGAQIGEWIGSPGTNQSRWRLLLHTPTGVETVAWLTLLEGAGPSARYGREWLRAGGVTLTGAALQQSHRLSLHGGHQDYRLAVRDEEPWGDAPWVFVERGATGERDWLTEGSARTRSVQAWVLATPDLIPRGSGGACEALGTLADLNRMVYRISGEVELLTPQQDRYRIACRADAESAETLVVVGNPVPQSLQQRPLYCGLPHIHVFDTESRQQPPIGRLQWRFLGNAAPWRESRQTAQGRLWLRLVDTSGNERGRRQVDVAPSTFRIETDIGTGNQAGVIRLTGLADADLRPSVECPAGIVITTGPDKARIVCPSMPGVLPPPLNLLLCWPGSELIPLTLPYPQRGAVFQLAGRPLFNDDWVPLDRLGGLQVLIQDPAGGRNFWLDGELLAQPNPVGEPLRQTFRTRLPPLEQGRLELSLLAWQNRIASLLAGSRDLEAQVRLLVKTGQGERLAHLRIARFDAVIEPDREAGLMRISADSLTRLEAGWETRIRLETFPLWQPGSVPVALSASPNQPGCWEIPADLPTGPWWIVGRDGDWMRFRPLLWMVATGETPVVADSALAAAVCESDPAQRQQKLDALLTELRQNPDHADWPLLFGYVRLAREFPPSALDILCRLAIRPRTLALALMKADDETFEPMWALSRQMPFWWTLLAVNDWRKMAMAYFGGLQTTLAEVDASGEIVFSLFQGFRERAKVRRLYWGVLCDWIQEQLFPNRQLNSELTIARLCPAVLEERIELMERELMGRHDAEDQWPESSEVMSYLQGIDSKYRYKHLGSFYRSVRCAPFVAAYLSLKAISPTERLISDLRLLRAFDSVWFENVYAIALALGLATLPLEN
ncbi:MAG: STY4851/ECs_5259 family protein [Candidatus Contendobacter sp.]|jgi:hypothetical protein|nr:STY4851/ECs_5259 family protein [Candidatus Contendobacter sp.]